jgi:acetyl esterase/lipase
MIFLLLAALLGAAPPSVVKNIEYARVGNVPLDMDLYLPAGSRAGVPVIVSIHGGGWHGGSKEASPGTHFTEYGYAVAAINYRLIDQGTFPAPIHDCKAAVRWLRANAAKYNLDTKRIGVWGASAGGHLAALLGTSGGVKDLEGDLGNAGYSSRVQAVVDYFGPTDLPKWRPTSDPRVNEKLSESRMMGFDVVKYPARAARGNPITYVSKDDPAFFIGHGQEDNLVPVSQSELLHAALRKAGVASELHVVPGAGHSVNGLALDAAVRAFFDRRLKR